MKRGYKICIAVIAILSSIGAACIGVGFVGDSTLSFGMRFVCNFFFIMQAIATAWAVISLFRKE